MLASKLHNVLLYYLKSRTITGNYDALVSLIYAFSLSDDLPLRSLSAKAVCDALLQMFTTFSIPKVISSDCGSNFTSKLTQEFLKRLGCSPRFSTPGHPEATGLVEHCNQSLKTMICKLAQSDTRGWYKLLPFVLSSFRERPSSTTHISPYTVVYDTLPWGRLSVLKESWASERPLPCSIGKKPEEYLQSLKENLEMARAYSDYYSDIKQRKYITICGARTGNISSVIRLPFFSFRTAFTDLNLYCMNGALALFALVSFSGYVC